METTTETHKSAKFKEGVIMVRGKGVGFMAIEGFEEDVLIERDALGQALDSDTVEIELKDKPKPGERQEAVVKHVVERGFKEYIGVVKKADPKAGHWLPQTGYYLQPDNRRIHVFPLLPDATDTHVGMKVAAELTDWKDGAKNPTMEIAEVLGPAGDHETEMQAIIRSGGFTTSFPEEVQKAAQDLYDRQDQIFADAVAESQKPDGKRRDFRGITTLTIDPHDAKDFDDALSFQILENGHRQIGIHIADVSHYVKEGETIDKEAVERATSIYLVDRVIPMLPEVLSNDLCSLRPNEDRLAFSAVLELDENANLVGEWYGQTIIHSDHRFSYQDAQAVLDSGAGDHHDALAELMRLGRILRTNRSKNGAIAFEQPEIKFELDENKKPIRAFVKDRIETMMMIEDFMLLANMSVAKYVQKVAKERGANSALLFRIHDAPDPEKVLLLEAFVNALGYTFKSDNGQVDGKIINALLKQVEGKPEQDLISVSTIRTMAKAIYSTKNIGHFGLAFTDYVHFTSPIRRYPDLMVHRSLRRILDEKSFTGKEVTRAENIAKQSTEREMVATKAERDSIKYKQVEFLMDRVGEEFDGKISGVSDWGMYVEAGEARAEGMVRLASIKSDYFEHFASKYHVKGQRTGKIYRLGDKIRVKLTRADLEERQLDFELIES